MDNFVIISDTHGLGYEVLDRLLPIINSADVLVHLGDGLRDLAAYRSLITVPIIRVRGNCDVASPDDEDVFVETSAGKVLFTHGHTHKVNGGLLDLALTAEEHGCRYVFYGHTHCYSEETYRGITLVNVPSLTRPRGFYRAYCTAFVEHGKLLAKIVAI